MSKKKGTVKALAAFLPLLLAVIAGDAAVTEVRAVTSATTPTETLQYQRLAQQIVDQLALQPGEKVLLVAAPGVFQEVIAPLRAAVIRAGGVDLGCWLVAIPPADMDRSLVQRAAAASRAALRDRLRGVDAAVMLPGASPENPEYAAMQDVLKEGHGRTVHFHWQAAGTPSAVELPGHPLPDRATIDATYQRAVLQSDCRAIGALQRRFAAALATGEVRITTPAGTDLRFRAGDRPVNFQDGDASAARAAQARILIDREIEIPCGALRLAPLEDTVEGTIAFPPATWNNHPVGPVTLRFLHGRVVEVTVPPGPTQHQTQQAVETELRLGGDAATAFREIALGFNPTLAIPTTTPWIPYYGYGAGVLRLSLGDNSELGGQVHGTYVRWNFFPDATLTLANHTWVQSGTLTPPP